MSRVSPRLLALVCASASLLLACGPEQGGTREVGGEGAAAVEAQVQTLDLGALRASAVDGLEAGLDEPGAQLGIVAALADPSLAALRRAQLERLAQQPQLARALDELFASLQLGEGMRALVLEHAAAHPELSPAQLAEGLGAVLEQRLTRAELVAALRRVLLAGSQTLEPSLDAAFMREAGGAEALAEAVAASLEQPAWAEQISASLGREGAQERLERRLADPRRAAAMLSSFAAFVATDAGLEQLGTLLVEPACTQALAKLAAQLLADSELRARFERLFALAVAQTLDSEAFVSELDGLLAAPQVGAQLDAALRALARDEALTRAVQALVLAYVEQPSFEPALREWSGVTGPR